MQQFRQVVPPPDTGASGRPPAVPLQLITLQMRHHAAASGYHRLTDVLPATVATGIRPASLPGRGGLRLLRPLCTRSGSRWYHRANLAGEIGAARRWLTSRSTLFHFLYGENSYRYLGLVKALQRRGNWLVATYHTPPWRLREVVRDTDHIRRLDAAVVVSTGQLDHFAALLGPERAFYVPHGIDTDFFRPASGATRARSASRPARFICVGHHLRDFDTLAATADILWQHDRESEIVVVASPDHLGPLMQLPNVKPRSNVSDAGLRALYQSSDALLLPLIDATANNALLEAMACGLPVLSTDIIGVRDYVTPACSALAPPGDAAGLADMAIRARNLELDLPSMGAASRAAAERLSWPRVARTMQETYAKITGLACYRSPAAARPKQESKAS